MIIFNSYQFQLIFQKLSQLQMIKEQRPLIHSHSVRSILLLVENLLIRLNSKILIVQAVMEILTTISLALTQTVL